MSERCPHDFKGSRSVKHLATDCVLYYKKRHDKVNRCCTFYTNKYGLNRSSKLKNYQVKKITTELFLEYNKLDLMIYDRRTKEITLIEVGITNKNILAKTKLRKSQKYDLLKHELIVMYTGCKVIATLVVTTWDGLVTRHFKGYMKQLEVTERLTAHMQSVVCESIVEDCRRMQRGDWLEDEVDEMMTQLETQLAGTEEAVQENKISAKFKSRDFIGVSDTKNAMHPHFY
ncbi:uncharacterized protein LOC120848510 [Ixodes scapularis]|uniref:uncharacterized protein LOC120848510 n=1 Tax=Ixodes scapularis TaxID=6945 RepID=UPI001C381BDB|nr:uncharacterized protein LOC120848510 [Ixodes scapularis]